MWFYRQRVYEYWAIQVWKHGWQLFGYFFRTIWNVCFFSSWFSQVDQYIVTIVWVNAKHLINKNKMCFIPYFWVIRVWKHGWQLFGYFFRTIWLALKRAVCGKRQAVYIQRFSRRDTPNQMPRRSQLFRQTSPVSVLRSCRLCCRRSCSTCCAHPLWRPVSDADCSGKHGCCFFWHSCSVSGPRQASGWAKQSGHMLFENDPLPRWE